jgi:glycosyltransferase involved in cell wall biosynthesis
MRQLKTDKPTVLMVGSLPPPYGGPETIMDALLKSPILTRGADLRHLSMKQPSRNEDSGRLSPQNIVNNLHNIFSFARQCFFHRPQIVYYVLAQNTMGCLRDGLYIIVAKLAGCKFLGRRGGGHFHSFYSRANPLLRFFLRATLKRADLITVESKSLKYQYEGVLPSQSKIVVLPLGIIPIECPIKGNFPAAALLNILYLGNISKAKGTIDLLKAFDLVVDLSPIRVELTIAGQIINTERNILFLEDAHDARNEIENHLLSETVGRSVHFPGPVYGEEKKALFQRADIFVLPSYSEGLSVALLEALSAGIPIVATRVGAAEDVLADGENGFLIEPGDWKGLADRITRLLGDPALRKKMGQANRDLFSQRYHIDNFARGLLNLICELAN